MASPTAVSRVAVAALADAEEPGLAAGRVLARHKPQPGGELPALTKGRSVADSGDDSRSQPRGLCRGSVEVSDRLGRKKANRGRFGLLPLYTARPTNSTLTIGLTTRSIPASVTYPNRRPLKILVGSRSMGFAARFGIRLIAVLRRRCTFEHFTRGSLANYDDLLASVDHGRNVAGHLFYMRLQYFVRLALRQRFDRR
jgi:hypothetical protein